MARKKRPEEHVNHERWLISYADFITLLFAFFTVMYAISVVNEGKFKVLSDSLQAAFNDPTRSLAPIQIGELVRAPIDMKDSIRAESKPVVADISADRYLVYHLPEPEDIDEITEELRVLAAEIEEVLAEYIERGEVNVLLENLWIEIEMTEQMLFDSGSDKLYESAFPVLDGLSETLREKTNKIHVEGFTDNMPINTTRFPSNWELSGARATTVVRRLESKDVNPTRLAAIGYGEHQPIADNTTIEGRAKNRRVVVVVLAEFDRDQETLNKFEKVKGNVSSTDIANYLSNPKDESGEAVASETLPKNQPVEIDPSTSEALPASSASQSNAPYPASGYSQ
ncbi:MAG: flagellar motor protein MotD [Gammaproteobacteria bacterium]|jgi:chemotaxis protein MotB|nr:flagellar motor protein MotD [Gammaproteobacteria bacterium]MBT5154523.1 flagellar motor protein MotD [Gammaproteobacteria bacterium]MBT5683675.1 flagellar motor protein MotD [Gammaproteobacteria bacterium]MBT5723578.1 flagellar motor protein MotD [Gammaproteobacteria bacterium]MBT6584244.1 flagellar motor protein MotD [Gammaproteobacteria bacterium]